MKLTERPVRVPFSHASVVVMLALAVLAPGIAMAQSANDTRRPWTMLSGGYGPVAAESSAPMREGLAHLDDRLGRPA